jgi:hypothetical protein
LGSDQAVFRVTGCIAPLGERRFVAGPLELQFKNALLFALAFHMPLFRRQCRLDRHRLDGADEFGNDRRIDTLARETHTAR